MTTPVFIGEQPGPGGVPAKGEQDWSLVPLAPWPRGSTGHNLMNLLGVDARTYLTEIVRLNLFSHRADGRWAIAAARESAQVIANSGLLHGRKVVLLGNRVWQAFFGDDHNSVFGVGSFMQQSYAVPGGLGATVEGVLGPFYHLPHPSGLNRWYNDEANAESAKRMLREVMGAREETE